MLKEFSENVSFVKMAIKLAKKVARFTGNHSLARHGFNEVQARVLARLRMQGKKVMRT